MKIVLFSLALLISNLTFAQSPTLPTNKPMIQPVLNEVIQDYFNDFRDILHDTLSQSEGIVTFESPIKLPGSISCMVSKYPPHGTYSWEAIMGKVEDFDSATKRYSQYFKELNNSKFTPDGYEKFILKGNYDAPDESRGFASTLMKFEASQKQLDHFTVDLGIQYEFPFWVIRIALYDKMPDQDIRPGMKTLQ